MRPVLRPPNNTKYKNYGEARPDLENALGSYCSYCEMVSPGAVEHILPWEGKHTSLKNEWSNLLLACAQCNGAKKGNGQDSTPYDDADAARRKYLWPDRDNTARAFEYRSTNAVVVNQALSGNEKALAESTLAMLNLGKTTPDRRWTARKSAWTRAEEMRRDWDKNPCPDTRRYILNAASDKGFWSVFRVVFKDCPDLLAALNDRFPGTAKDCFDPQTQAPVARAGGLL